MNIDANDAMMQQRAKKKNSKWDVNVHASQTID